MTDMKSTRILRMIVFVSILLLCSVNESFAVSPAIFFSDLTDGPITGWESSQAKGAAVSIWGLNLGTSRGSSYINIGSVKLTADSDYAEWGVTNTGNSFYNGYNSARGLQRITFWLNSSMPLGETTISVTTANGTSNTIPFYTRNTGNIYFLSPNGINSNSGRSVGDAWRDPKQARIMLKAGDIAYFKAGVYDASDYAATPISFSNTNHNNGAINNSITMASYPGEFAQLGSSTNEYCIRHIGTAPGDVLTFWTFSKFIMRSNFMITNWGTRENLGHDDNVKLIGNDCSTLAGGSSILEFAGQQGGQTNLYILGNYIHDAGLDNRGDSIPNHSYGIYMGGYGLHNYIYIGFNEISHQAYGRAIQIYGHTVFDSIDNLYIYNNLIHSNSQNGCVLGGGDGREGSYNYEFVKKLFFYNNIVVNNDQGGNAWAGLMVGGVGYGAHGGTYYIYNNTFYNNGTGAYQLDGSPAKVVFQNNLYYSDTGYYESDSFDNQTTVTIEVGGNYYYGNATDIPSWESDFVSSPLSLDQVFSGAAIDNFALTPDHEAEDAGLTIPFVTVDYMGSERVAGMYSVGAFENQYSGLVIIIDSMN